MSSRNLASGAVLRADCTGTSGIDARARRNGECVVYAYRLLLLGQAPRHDGSIMIGTMSIYNSKVDEWEALLNQYDTCQNERFRMRARVPNTEILDDAKGDITMPAVVLVNSLFGGIHCLSWKFTFPSLKEQLRWRTGAVLTIAMGPVLAIVMFLWSMLNTKLDPRVRSIEQLWSLLVLYSSVIRPLRFL